MTTARWRRFPITLFDCDSTLSAVEGIDELAVDPEQQSSVAALTDKAMAGDVPLEDVYGERLSLLNPTQGDIRSLKLRYKSEVVPDAKAVLDLLKAEGNQNWIISGGLLEPVAEFAAWLGVAPNNVRAVPTQYDPLDGEWWSAQEGNGQQSTRLSNSRYASYSGGHLTNSTGKHNLIAEVVTDPGRKLLIGDGASDLAAAGAVDLFVAFAGVVARDAVVANAPVVVTSTSLAPVLALALGRSHVRDIAKGVGVSANNNEFREVASRCLDLIDEGSLVFNDPELASRFETA